MNQLAILYRNAISMLEARRGGAGGSLGPKWKAGL